jgi:Tol biopolymer transport system component
MIDDRELFERASLRFDPPPGELERLLRRRDRKQRNHRIGAGALAIILALVSFVALTRAFRSNERPADESPALRRNGEVISYTDYHSYTGDARAVGDLVAQDPDTGDVRTLVAAGALSRFRSVTLIGSAAWSADGRWVAFEVLACSRKQDKDGGVGLWVTNGLDEPRHLTSPCFEDPEVAPFNELWAWSPTGAQLVVARRSIDGDSLLVIDPATGDRTDLGEAAGRVTTLTWSPDGTRITYGALGGGGSIYSVGVGGGEHSLLASSLGRVSNQGVVFGWGIRWSPDGAHIVVQTYGNGAAMNKLLLMNADGSDIRQLAEGLDVQTSYWKPGLSWSPDGTRMAYATFSGGREERNMRIWIGSADGSAPSLLFESAPAPFGEGGNPVWSPDGAQIAFESTTTDGEAVWLVTNADGTGDADEIDELRYLSWRGGWYFCGCYG